LEKVEIIEEYADWTIRSAKLELAVPSVVRLLERVRKRRAMRFSRENIYNRDKGRCQYCNLKVSRNEFTYEHVVPRAQGGQTRWENIVCSCVDCNQKKGDRTPEQAGMRLKKAAAKPKPGSLPVTLKLSYSKANVPESWRNWLRSVIYWQGEVASD
jgi:5-methylcytosine-specific restriction endonuclease McrA